jgi:hypothetical protein
LQADRLAIVEALESRSPERVATAVDAYAAHSKELILSTSEAKKIQVSDPGYINLLAGLLDTRLGSAAR